MKKSLIVLFLCVSVAVACCQEQPNLGLIPTPQRVERQAGSCNPQKVKVKEQKVSSLPVEANMDQAYRLDITPKGITVSYTSEAGRQNAYLTIGQLGRLYGNSLPCVTITDWPAYKWRGWMDDISRGPVTHERYRALQWETLHALKYNFCNYYTEHTLYQTEYPDLAPAYADCRRHPDELINLQLFAHAEKTLRVPFYQYMIDSKSNFNPDVEVTYDFLADRIRAAIAQIPESPFFIINCDETEQLGSGRARQLVDEKGADEVYVGHINRCCELIDIIYQSPQFQQLRKSGDQQVRPVMWGDIVAKNPSMMKQLPANMVYIMWAYEPLESYDHLIKPFKEQGNPFWVAPSLSHSGNILPNPYCYMKNIANLARDGYLGGAEGLMNTCWDDSGEALFDNCWHGLFWSAEMAWNPIKSHDPDELRRREELFNLNFERLFYDGKRLEGQSGPTPNTTLLYKFGSFEHGSILSDWYLTSSLWEPLLDINPTILERDDMAAFDLLSQIEQDLDSASNPHVFYACLHMLASNSKLTLQKAIDRQLRQGDYAYDCMTFANVFFYDLKTLKNVYLRLWDQENGDYERYVVMNRYDEMARQVLSLDRHVFVDVLQDGQPYPVVSLRTLYGGKDIYYTLDGSEPTTASTLYTAPFRLERSSTIRAVAYNDYGEGVETSHYLLSHLAMGAAIDLRTKYGSDYKAVYSGGGSDALIDGRLGSNTSYTDGHWQGYWGDSIDACIDLGAPRELHRVSMRFVQNTFDWVLAPTAMKLYVSDDGSQWRLLAAREFDTDPRETGFRLKHYSLELPPSSAASRPTRHPQEGCFRYIRVVVPNPGPLPEWHTAPGQQSWLFADEIVVE